MRILDFIHVFETLVDPTILNTEATNHTINPHLHHLYAHYKSFPFVLFLYHLVKFRLYLV